MKGLARVIQTYELGNAKSIIRHNFWGTCSIIMHVSEECSDCTRSSARLLLSLLVALLELLTFTHARCPEPSLWFEARQLLVECTEKPMLVEYWYKTVLRLLDCTTKLQKNVLQYWIELWARIELVWQPLRLTVNRILPKYVSVWMHFRY